MQAKEYTMEKMMKAAVVRAFG